MDIKWRQYAVSQKQKGRWITEGNERVKGGEEGIGVQELGAEMQNSQHLPSCSKGSFSGA